MPTMPDQPLEVTLGVDTHEDEHVAALLDQLGRLLATRSFPATAGGYRQLLAWAHGHGSLVVAGVEGTGSFGAGLARFLAAEDIQVIEVTRPSRRGRRHLGKSDTVDAEAAARMVLSGEATATPKRRDGIVESIRVLQIARRSAIFAVGVFGSKSASLPPGKLGVQIKKTAGLGVAAGVDTRQLIRTERGCRVIGVAGRAREGTATAARRLADRGPVRVEVVAVVATRRHLTAIHLSDFGHTNRQGARQRAR